MFSPDPCGRGSKPPRQAWGLNRGKGLFITATDTGVGKTLIAGAIAKILSQKSKKTRPPKPWRRRVGVFKPVATGCKKTTDGLISEDALFLKSCADSSLSLSLINPISFEIPAAPFACQKTENKKVDLKKISAAYKQICQKSDFVIVEGIGGIRVPITNKFDVLDLAKAFNLPVVIVARSKLGTINHTLLTIDAIRSAGLSLAGVIVNGYDETGGLAEKTAAAIIQEIGKVRIIATVPFDDTTNTEKCIIGQKVLNALQNVDWLRMIEDFRK